ncbi:MAG: hypothetical protein K2O65_14430 [Lachnospiraceae bacterium]|nr:hypothetical protein [Lachnospiraceae bacterium]
MYALSHNIGETYFQTLKDAILTMYLIARYDKDCEAEFSETKTEIDWISRIVEEGRYYENGFFILYKSE